MAENLLVVYDADTKVVRMVVDHPDETAYEWQCWVQADVPVSKMVVPKAQFGDPENFASNIQDHITANG